MNNDETYVKARTNAAIECVDELIEELGIDDTRAYYPLLKIYKSGADWGRKYVPQTESPLLEAMHQALLMSAYVDSGTGKHTYSEFCELRDAALAAYDLAKKK